MQLDTVSRLEQFNKRFEDIKLIKDRQIKNYRLEALLTDLENVYDIPRVGPLRIQAFRFSFPRVMDLHDKASVELTTERR